MAIPGTKLYNGAAPMEVISSILRFLPPDKRVQIVFAKTKEGQLENPELIPCYFQSIQLNATEWRGAELEPILKSAIESTIKIPRIYIGVFKGEDISPALLELALHYSFACDDADLRQFVLDNPTLRHPSCLEIVIEKWGTSHQQTVIDLLKLKQVNPTAKNNAAIYIASKYGHVEVVKALLEDGRADPVIGLAVAAKYGHVEVVKALLKDKRVDPRALQSDALRRAAKNGHLEVVKVLLEDGRADPRASNSCALWSAAEKGHVEVVKALLEDGRADPTVWNSYALWSAAEKGHVEVVKALLEDGRADPTAMDSFALWNAAERGHAEVVKALLKDGRADPTAADSRALLYAARNGDAEVVKALLEDGRADPTEGNSKVLRIAAESGNLAVLKALLEDGRADPTARDNYDALHKAFENEHVEVVKILKTSISKHRKKHLIQLFSLCLLFLIATYGIRSLVERAIRVIRPDSTAQIAAIQQAAHTVLQTA